MPLNECFICGRTDGLWYCYPVQAMDRTRGATLCTEHQKLREQEPDKFDTLLRQKVGTSKTGVK